MNKTVFSISQINDYVRGLINNDPILNDIWIRGEISNLAVPTSGHMYFTLKDKKARVRCIMFKSYNVDLNFLPTNGMQVIVNGQASLYLRDGQYQLYVYKMEPDGIGDLHATYDALKTQLESEGLFDSRYKKPIPLFPRKVAVITSHTGAAIRDIINIVKRRCKTLSILVIPVLVQGRNAAAQISAALDYVNTRQDIDIIIVGRGGGSIEELWAFNEEKVARAIWRSEIPVVSAVGHETDNTISDLVADVRAPTPSAAAELVAPDMLSYRQLLNNYTEKLYNSIKAIYKAKAQKLHFVKANYTLRHPDRLIHLYSMKLDGLSKRNWDSIEENIRTKREHLAKLSVYLDAISPLKILSRGYAMITKEDNRIVQDVGELSPGDLIDVKLKDGAARCKVDEIKSHCERIEGYKYE